MSLHNAGPLFRSKEQLALVELARRKKMELYQKRPDLWLTERFGEPISTFRWDVHEEYKNHEWDGTPNPFLSAAMAISKKRWVGIESATSTGKTFTVARLIYWFLDVYPNSLVVTTAPKKDQLKKILWTEIGNCFNKFKSIRANSEMLSLNIVVDGRTRHLSRMDPGDSVSGMGWEAIGIVSGVSAGEDSATKMQGFHRENMLFLLEEMAGIHPAVLTAIINTSTAKNNIILGIGNPDSQIDTLHTFCNMKKVDHIVVSAYDHPNVVCKRTVIPGAVSIDSIELRKEEYGEDSNFFRSRVRGIAPEEGTSALIKSEWIDQCTVTNPKFVGVEIDNNSANAAGIDVANSVDGDEAAIALGKKNELLHLQSFHCKNATHLAYNLIYDGSELARREYTDYRTPILSDWEILPQHTGIDGVGVGVATVNAFWDLKIKVVSLIGGQLDTAVKTGTDGEVLYKFNNLRSQMFFELREDLRCHLVRINLPPKLLKDLKKELILHDFKVQGGKIAVESKENVKKKLGGASPNLADCVVYWNWMRKNHYKKAKPMPMSSGNKS
ncbi:MAG: hypothetical protein EKK63_01775 [Acinetobacter sp.]|uniref:hypothetical protein n=1 Tax=Acinetobacter sp. TaxID=472 RepID=UPI000FB4E765|nr:hypothetical protein [Acinetobacter sp.]RUP42334.1 MAG: hypothetical protein EKK63_01775 [Acinetobacter sp.]